MNKRIRELLNEATVGLEPDLSPQRTVTLNELEKFAELIIRECIAQASISNSHGNNQWDKALTFAADNIKKRFGVEL